MPVIFASHFSNSSLISVIFDKTLIHSRSMNRYTDLNIGYTFPFFGPGVLVILVGLACFLFSWIIAVFFILCGCAVLAFREGILADGENKRIMKYYALFNYKSGTWIDVKHYDHILLRYTSDTLNINHRGGSSTIRSRTYDIVLCNEKGREEEIHDFTEYKKAEDALQVFAHVLQLKPVNKVAETWSSVAERQRKRGRR